MIALGLALIFAVRADAKIFTFKELDCTCEVPDSWVFQDKGGFLVSVVDQERKRSFLLRVFHTGPSITLSNRTLISAIEQGVATQGFTISDRETVTANGITYYRVNGTKDLGNKSIYSCLYVTLANGYAYIMNCSSYQPSPENDPELKGMVESLTFINPPKLPSNSWTNVFVPRDGLPHDATYLASYRLGVMIVLLLVVTFPAAILVAIGLGIYFLSRGRRTGALPPLPGPPPANFPPS